MRRVFATDGNVGFLAGGGLVMFLMVLLLLVVLGAPSALSGLVALLATVAVLWPAALIWALSIYRVLDTAPRVPGRILGSRVTWRGLLVVDFVYVVAGSERRASNIFMPRSKASRLRPDQIVRVAVPTSAFPGPLILDAYE